MQSTDKSSPITVKTKGNGKIEERVLYMPEYKAHHFAQKLGLRIIFVWSKL